MKNYQKILLVAAGCTLVLASIFAIWATYFRQVSPLPTNVYQQVTFVAYYPAKPWTAKWSKATFNRTSKVLTITLQSGARHILLNQQMAPDQFTDIPNYYSTLLTKLNNYQSLSTVAGTVYLTRPAELHGAQVAVLNDNGTLLFAQPDKDLDASTWRQLFNNLQVLKPVS